MKQDLLRSAPVRLGRAPLALCTLPLLLAACQGDDDKDGRIARCEAAPKALKVADGQGRWVDGKDGLPGFCEVKGTLSPAEGSRIGVVYRLPEDWNGKMLGLGGGGWAGNVTIEAATQGLRKGYAVAQTDGGNPNPEGWDVDWTKDNPVAVTDFSWRAVHEMTVAGKSVVNTHYGRQPDRSYFQGCSTGGRMALVEAQRYPDDYDGIIAGAPVHTLQVQTTAILRNNDMVNKGFTMTHMQRIHESVLQACDGHDGAMDGVIGDPRNCNWDPSALQCDAGQVGDTCLTPEQVASVRRTYEGLRSSDGEWAQLPVSKGSELNWAAFFSTEVPKRGGAVPGLKPMIFGDYPVDYADFDPDADTQYARSTAFAKGYEAVDPDLSAFFGRGGKLILWHGESDPGPSPVGMLDYAEAVQKAQPNDAEQGLRTYMLPGVNHCSGGPGADTVNWLDALDQWVDQGKAPATLLASRADDSRTRPVCAWPQVLRYQGQGDVAEAGNWRCEVPQL